MHFQRRREAEARLLQRASAKKAFLRRRKQGGPGSVSALEPTMIEIVKMREAAAADAARERQEEEKRAAQVEADALWRSGEAPDDGHVVS